MHGGPKKPKKRGSEVPIHDDEEDDMHYINSSRGGHGAPMNLNGGADLPESLRTSSHLGGGVGPGDANSSGGGSSSMVTSRGGEGPPKVYEEMIQVLEGDVRKHIRIEQQLKLHIETVEGRLDELEAENEKLISECQRLEQACADGDWQAKKQL